MKKVSGNVLTNEYYSVDSPHPLDPQSGAYTNALCKTVLCGIHSSISGIKIWVAHESFNKQILYEGISVSMEVLNTGRSFNI